MDILRAAIIGSMFVVINCNHCLIFGAIRLMPLIQLLMLLLKFVISMLIVECCTLLSIVNSIHPWNWLLIVPLSSWYLQSPSSLFPLYVHHPSIVGWPSYLYEFHALFFSTPLATRPLSHRVLSLCPQFIDCIISCNHVDELWLSLCNEQRWGFHLIWLIVNSGIISLRGGNFCILLSSWLLLPRMNSIP